MIRLNRALWAGAVALLMLLIAVSGNYGFFNLLTLALCVVVGFGLGWLGDLATGTFPLIAMIGLALGVVVADRRRLLLQRQGRTRAGR